MTRALLTLSLAAALTAACGGGGRATDPESVVRAWSSAINRADDEAAASLFADGATVIQANVQITLEDHEAALRWNTGLPCAGRIVEATVEGDEVRATFVLGERPGHRCDSPGTSAAAVIRVEHGKIVLWHQTPTEEEPGLVA